MGRKRSKASKASKASKLKAPTADEYMTELLELYSDPKKIVCEELQNPTARARASQMFEFGSEAGTQKQIKALRRFTLRETEDSIKNFGEYLQERPYEAWWRGRLTEDQTKSLGRRICEGHTARKLAEEAANTAQDMTEGLLNEMDEQELKGKERRVLLTIEPTVLGATDQALEPDATSDPAGLSCTIRLTCPSLSGKTTGGICSIKPLDTLPTLDEFDTDCTERTQKQTAGIAKREAERTAKRLKQRAKRCANFEQRIKSKRLQSNYQLFTDIYTKSKRNPSALTTAERFIYDALRDTLWKPYEEMQADRAAKAKYMYAVELQKLALATEPGVLIEMSKELGIDLEEPPIPSEGWLSKAERRELEVQFQEGLASFDETIKEAIKKTQAHGTRLYDTLLSQATVTEGKEADRTESPASGALESDATSLPVERPVSTALMSDAASLPNATRVGSKEIGKERPTESAAETARTSDATLRPPLTSAQKEEMRPKLLANMKIIVANTDQSTKTEAMTSELGKGMKTMGDRTDPRENEALRAELLKHMTTAIAHTNRSAEADTRTSPGTARDTATFNGSVAAPFAGLTASTPPVLAAAA